MHTLPRLPASAPTLRCSTEAELADTLYVPVAERAPRAPLPNAVIRRPSSVTVPSASTLTHFYEKLGWLTRPVPGPKPALESAFRRWSPERALDESSGSSEGLSFKVYPPVAPRSSREVSTVRPFALVRPDEPQAPSNALFYAAAMGLGVFFAMIALVAIVAVGGESNSQVVSTTELHAVPMSVPEPAIAPPPVVLETPAPAASAGHTAWRKVAAVRK